MSGPAPDIDELEISVREKAWGVAIAVLAFPVGLLALLGLMLNQGWARWLGLVLGGLIGVGWGLAAVWLLAVVLPGAGSSYPFAPWFVFIAALAAVIGLLAARVYLRAIRADRSPEPE